jgi:polysaccharide export outer membrane protein
LIAVAAASCHAQVPGAATDATNPPATTAAQPQITAAQPQVKTSNIGVGDQLLISVADLDEVTNKAVRVAEDGTLDLPLIGSVQASGTNLNTLRAALANGYAKYVTNPQVSVQLVSSQNQLISVIGDVNTPSVQELTGPVTLLAAITRAGGAKADAGPQVIVTREARWGILPIPGAELGPGGAYSRASLSLDDLVSEKAPENNILLRAGDVVSIPKGSIVYVIGDVHKSGGFPLRSKGSISVIEALSLAEGLSPNAKSKNAKILRPGPNKADKRQEIPIDISQVLAGKGNDMQLFADDILFVPSSAVKSGTRRVAEAVLQVTTGVLIYH